MKPVATAGRTLLTKQWTSAEENVPPKKPVTEQPTKSLKQIVEDNVFVVVVGIAVFAGGAVYGVVHYFESQRFQLQVDMLTNTHEEKIRTIEHDFRKKIETMQSRLSSVERRIGDQKYFAIENFFTSREKGNDGDTSAKGDDLIKYFEDGDYFAPTDPEQWIFARMKEGDLFAEMTGIDNALPPDANLPIDVWKSREEHKIDGSKIFKKLFSAWIVVERVSYQDLVKAAVSGREEGKKGTEEVKEGTGEVKGKEGTEQLRRVAENQLKLDATGTFFTTVLVGTFNMSLMDPNITYSLKNIQKVGPVLYAQMVFKLSDIKIDDLSADKIYLVRELFTISGNDSIFLLQTNAIADVPPLAGYNFTGQNFDHINVWLAGFHLASQ